MSKKYYIACKDDKGIIYGHIDCESIQGFDIKPQNNIPYAGVEVGHLTLVEPELIKKVLKRKIKRKLNTYLNFLMAMVDDEDNDSDALVLVIDDLERYKSIIINKYSKFLDKRYLSAMLKKIGFVERELSRKIKELSYTDSMETTRRR